MPSRSFHFSTISICLVLQPPPQSGDLLHYQRLHHFFPAILIRFLFSHLCSLGTPITFNFFPIIYHHLVRFCFWSQSGPSSYFNFCTIFPLPLFVLLAATSTFSCPQALKLVYLVVTVVCVIFLPSISRVLRPRTPSAIVPFFHRHYFHSFFLQPTPQILSLLLVYLVVSVSCICFPSIRLRSL